MKLRNYLAVLPLSLAALAGCGDDVTRNAPFENRVYIDAASKTETMPLKPSFREAMRTVKAAVPKPAAQDVKLVFKADPALVDTYNTVYYDSAELLGEEFYELSGADVLLSRGTVHSSEATVSFHDLNRLDRDKVYVLPVTIADVQGISVLESARTLYYVFKGVPSISVVADMEKKNYVSIPTFLEQKPAAAVCNDLERFTMEALIRVRKFEPGIQTIMGTEGDFLLRISDNGLQPNQLQFVTPYGNLSNDNCQLSPDKWVHVAATYDMHAKEAKLYIDGELAVEKNDLQYTGVASFGKPAGWQQNKFYIGYSYAPGRELDGEMSELRIWNVVRTQEEIAANPYEVEPDASGLIAYWKFNEGGGSKITDHTGNGNDGEAKNPIQWTPVSLPAPK